MRKQVRPPAVAGLFYPASESELRRAVERHLEEAAAAETPPAPPEAIIAPHAGYVYSGPVAGTAFKTLAQRPAPPRRVILLGPAHRVPVRGLALPEVRAFLTPLGEVPVDGDLAAAVADLPQVVVSDVPHAEEHSLEGEPPFLELLCEDLAVLPLVVGSCSAEEVAEVLERAWEGDDTVVVISSDLSHYLPYEAARRMDNETAREIVDLEGPIRHEQACGATPVNGLLLAARRRGLEARLLDLRNSGDTAGDKSRVVGYGAFSFHAAA
jgi:AmmeMemoRadiSam system protein B